jgi:hypothetical protein
MTKAKLCKEIVVRVGNKIGVLAQLTKLLAEKGIDLIAVNGYREGEVAVFRIITTDNLRATDVLRDHNYAPRETECVVIDLPHKPGMLRNITERLAMEQIDIRHLYASAAEDQNRCLITLDSTRNERAVVALNKELHATAV